MSHVPEQEISSRLFRTGEMVTWLRQKLDAPDELGEAVLAAWVGALRYAALTRAEREASFFQALRKGEGFLSLSATLAPEGWRNEYLWAQVTQQTGVSVPAARELLAAVAAKLHELADEKEFEPVGQFRVKGRGGEGGFTVRCRRDFLQPVLNESADLVQGIPNVRNESGIDFLVRHSGISS